MAEATPAGRPCLSIELHAATRTQHADLNRTIIARLPLCLPQITLTPALYVQGMTVFGWIYVGLEEAWDLLLAQNELNQKHRNILTQLNLARLRRKEKLEASLQHATAVLDDRARSRISDCRLATMHFGNEIRESILHKPHLVMAYTWTMYLALFNGGRWIAKQLLTAGTSFWGRDHQSEITSGPLSFWYFDEDETYNGDDLKQLFKQRFNDVAETLTDVERDEIILETKKVFQICTEMIEYLDQHARPELPIEALPSTKALNPPSQPDSSQSILGHLASFTPTPIVGLCQFMLKSIPFSSGMLQRPLHPEIEHHNA